MTSREPAKSDELKARFRQPANSGAKAGRLEYRFDELSDGHRKLIALYTAFQFAVKSNSTLCINEPENFIALPEIQRWLLNLQDRLEEQKAQVFWFLTIRN